MHDVVVVAAGIDERKRYEERHNQGAQELRNVLSFQNLPCAPLANLRPNSPIGRNNSINVSMIIP